MKMFFLDGDFAHDLLQQTVSHALEDELDVFCADSASEVNVDAVW